MTDAERLSLIEDCLKTNGLHQALCAFVVSLTASRLDDTVEVKKCDCWLVI